MVLVSLTEDPVTGHRVWVVELDGVLAGRFDTKDEVAVFLRKLGRRADPDRPWPRHQIV